ncbi:hypothetical protein DL240_11325 [Lujinxingia litoralis]|uniref:Uncharacterized protein n=1 Tax=Lujinxingia litoralis TaxID=2211119 RepID=A0A328C7P4_9DELT|nr:MYXO-CTERM sorting domain-containing protein [Lujinxingia litoralis]RAL22430.1 hypothetical protein DL240_11325 [Lujinxingia litoralis]
MKTSRKVALVAALVASQGCGGAEDSSVGRVEQTLGESTPAYYFGGESSQSMPSYEERGLAHVWNLARRDPGAAGVLGPLGELPALVDPYFTEMARWQGRHTLESDCVCPSEEEELPPAKSCCEVGLVDGEVACFGEVVSCEESSGTSEAEERWRLFGLASGVPHDEVGLRSESAEAVGAAELEALALSVVRAELGVIAGEHSMMGAALVRRGQENYVGWVGGESARGLPAIVDGIHMVFGGGGSSPFGAATPPGQATFSMLYVEPNGPPSSSAVVFEEGCQAMSLTTPGAWTGRDAENPFVGGQLRLDVAREPGCHRYVFAATDTYGVGHTYPTYGSLGAEVGPDGAVLVNTEACPIWSPARPSLACLEPALGCQEGDERPCYSGREATLEGAACERGVERCEQGWWSGQCDGESTPDATERCSDDGSGGTPPDSGGGAGDEDGEQEGCGCASSGAPGNFGGVLLVVGWMAVWRVRHRRATTSPVEAFKIG